MNDFVDHRARLFGSFCRQPTDGNIKVISTAINRAYAEKHGHGFVACDTREESLGCPPNFPDACCKLPCLQRVLADTATKMVFFLDSDAIVRDLSMSVLCLIANPAEPALDSKIVEAIQQKP